MWLCEDKLKGKTCSFLPGAFRVSKKARSAFRVSKKRVIIKASLVDIMQTISAFFHKIALYHPGLNRVEPFDENEHRISLLKFHKKEATVRPAEFVCVCVFGLPSF